MRYVEATAFYTVSALVTVPAAIGIVLIAPAFACLAYHHSIRTWRSK